MYKSLFEFHLLLMNAGREDALENRLRAIRYRSLELVGLNQENNGRICGAHPTNCGVAVQPGSFLRLRNGTADIPRVVKVAVQAAFQTHATSAKCRGRPKKTVVVYEEQVEMHSEPKVKGYLWNGQIEGCCVGMVSRAFQATYGSILDGRVVEVRELASQSDSESMRKRRYEKIWPGALHCRSKKQFIDR